MLRGGSSPDEARVITNCSELWACAFRNWGALRGTKKLIAHQGDPAKAILEFAKSTYDAGSTLAKWDREALAYP